MASDVAGSVAPAGTGANKVPNVEVGLPTVARTGATIGAGGGTTCDASVCETFTTPCIETHVIVRTTGGTAYVMVHHIPLALSEIVSTTGTAAMSPTWSVVTCRYSKSLMPVSDENGCRREKTRWTAHLVYE